MAGNLTINQINLGDSATVTNNFVLKTNVDGTATLERGNGVDILTIDANGRVAFPNNVVAFSAYKSGANQTVTSGVAALVTFQTETFDEGGFFNLGTGRFTPLVAGYYQVNAAVYGSASPITSTIVTINKNGSIVAGSTVGAVVAVCQISEVIFMNGTTDYLEVFGTVTGTTPVIGFGSGPYTRFSAALIAKA